MKELNFWGHVNQIKELFLSIDAEKKKTEERKIIETGNIAVFSIGDWTEAESWIMNHSG